MAFTSLNHYLDAEWLEYAFECTRKDGAVGVDGQTAESYAANLQQKLSSLIERLKSGRYRAPPVRRHYIPKAGGGERGLGIPSFEDKVAQRAITMLLEPIYEHTEQVRPRLRGPSTLVRFCDDFVMCFTHKADAERVLAVLDKRLGKFGLQLHPDKTRLVDFRPRRSERDIEESTLPTTFNFLGFTHVWGKSRKGAMVVRQLTAKDRLRVRSRRSINDASECCIGRSARSTNDYAGC